jgi:hypothetical protein
MFGIPALGATPFASQAGNIYVFSIFENIHAQDNSTQLSAFLNNINESITPDDVNTLAAQFIFSIAEATTNATIIDKQFVFNAFVMENIGVFDAVSITAWIKIINDQAAAWALANNATVPNLLLIDNTQNSSWSVVSNSETTNWSVVESATTAGWTNINTEQ